MTREELEDTLTQARGFGGFGLDPFFASILDHDQQQRDELTSWRTTAQSVGAVDPHALACQLGEQRDEIAQLREALRFYADPQTYGLHGGSVDRILQDRGKHAQAALKDLPIMQRRVG